MILPQSKLVIPFIMLGVQNGCMLMDQAGPNADPVDGLIYQGKIL